eukprot:8643748-Pyramimonas_sp.AAC.1
MRSSAEGVFAAGDACTASWEKDPSAHWFQMRLWTQARAHGRYAAHCMAAGNPGADPDLAVGFHLELFTHTARFFGLKVRQMYCTTST